MSLPTYLNKHMTSMQQTTFEYDMVHKHVNKKLNDLKQNRQSSFVGILPKKNVFFLIKIFYKIFSEPCN